MSAAMDVVQPAAGVREGVREVAHAFGDGLVGVLAHPPAGTPAQPVAMVLFNAGLVPRGGPHRGSVELARALAGDGFPTLRFDWSGLGDSPLASAPDAGLRARELDAALALVTAETGIDRFVVGGICSAADHAFRLAPDEPRIVGLLLLDGLAYRTAGFWLRHLPPRLLRPRRLWRWLRQRGRQPAMADFRDFPPRREAAATLQALVARGVRVLAVFTGGAYPYFNHAGQAGCLGPATRSPRFSLAYWRECDHTFYLRRDRARLAGAVRAWMRREFVPAH